MSSVQAPYPASRLAPFIRQAMLANVQSEASDTTRRVRIHEGKRHLAVILSRRMGGTVDSADRRITRILYGEEEWLTERTVDWIATALGYHPGMIYPEYWMESTERTARKMEATSA